MSFRARLTLFFLAIVITPLIVLAVAGGRHRASEAQGQVDARLEGASFGIAAAMKAQLDLVSHRLTSQAAARAVEATEAGRGLDDLRLATQLDYLIVMRGGRVIASSVGGGAYLPGVDLSPSRLAVSGAAGLAAARRVTVIGGDLEVWGGLYRDARFLRRLPFASVDVAAGRAAAQSSTSLPSLAFDGIGPIDAGDGWRALCVCSGNPPSGVAILARAGQGGIGGLLLFLLVAGGAILGAAIASVLAKLLTTPLGRLADRATLAIGTPTRGDEVARVDAAFAVLSERLSEKERLSITDPLTGAWNRRYLDATLMSEVRRAERYGHPFSLLMIDVDRFRAVNEAHGHLAGDRVLAEVAARIGRSTRESVDVLARVGGDEFILILPETGLPAGRVVAAKLVELVRSTPLHTGAEEIWVTISVGLAAYPDHGKTALDLLGSADDGLYRAKAGGRDRVDEGSETRPPDTRHRGDFPAA